MNYCIIGLDILFIRYGVPQRIHISNADWDILRIATSQFPHHVREKTSQQLGIYTI